MAKLTSERFYELQGVYRRLDDSLSRLDWSLQQKYPPGMAWWVYCTRTESNKRNSLRRQLNKTIDRIYNLIDSAYPGNKLHSGPGVHTVCSEWDWEEVEKHAY